MQKNHSYNDTICKEQINNFNHNFQRISLEQNWNPLSQSFDYNKLNNKMNKHYSNEYIQSLGNNYINNQNL